MRPESEFWIMRPFHGVFYLSVGAVLLILIAASLAMRGRSERTKRLVIAIVCGLTLIGFFVYKYCLSIDGEYNTVTELMGGFNWWGELPLQLCNINMILIPIAVLLDRRPLMSFCFFVGPFGALMALLMPGRGFEGYSIFLPRMLGYYGTHFMVVIMGLAIVTFGLYRPRFRDLPMGLVTIFVIALAVFGVNMLLRTTGLHPKANYFFSVETEGNFLLEIFRSWIPVPFLYLLPSIPILGGYMSLVTFGFWFADRRRDGKKKRQAVLSQ